MGRVYWLVVHCEMLLKRRLVGFRGKKEEDFYLFTTAGTLSDQEIKFDSVPLFF
jgi:hypothetical protein